MNLLFDHIKINDIVLLKIKGKDNIHVWAKIIKPFEFGEWVGEVIGWSAGNVIFLSKEGHEVVEIFNVDELTKI